MIHKLTRYVSDYVMPFGKTLYMQGKLKNSEGKEVGPTGFPL